MSAITSAIFLNVFFDTRGVAIYFPSGFWGWIIVGLIAGWLAGKISRGRGFGCIADIILGIVGSFIGGWIFMRLEIYGRRLSLFPRRCHARRRPPRLHRASLQRQRSLVAHPRGPTACIRLARFDCANRDTTPASRPQCAPSSHCDTIPMHITEMSFLAQDGDNLSLSKSTQSLTGHPSRRSRRIRNEHDGPSSR